MSFADLSLETQTRRIWGAMGVSLWFEKGGRALEYVFAVRGGGGDARRHVCAGGGELLCAGGVDAHLCLLLLWALGGGWGVLLSAH